MRHSWLGNPNAMPTSVSLWGRFPSNPPMRLSEAAVELACILLSCPENIPAGHRANTQQSVSKQQSSLRDPGIPTPCGGFSSFHGSWSSDVEEHWKSGCSQSLSKHATHSACPTHIWNQGCFQCTNSWCKNTMGIFKSQNKKIAIEELPYQVRTFS